ncbi:MAG: hypothetical protein ACR2MB_08575 [Acidimicrobiales bacterium]
MKQRILATLAAIALVGVALFGRELLRGSDSGSGPSGTGSNGNGGLPVVACTPDLDEICHALADDGKIAKGTDTLDLDGAAAPPPKVEAWITWDPAPQVANVEAGGAERWAEAKPMMSAPLATVTWETGRAELSKARCPVGNFERPRQVATCMTAILNSQVTLGVGDGSTSESIARLITIGPAFVDNNGQADRATLRAIAGGAPLSGTAKVQATAQTQPARGASVVFGPESALKDIAQKPAGRNSGLEVHPLGDQVMEVVLAPRRGGDLTNVADASQSDGLAPVRKKLGLSIRPVASNKVDAGVMYQVWKALR